MMKITLKNPGELDALYLSGYEKFWLKRADTGGIAVCRSPLPNERAFASRRKPIWAIKVM